MLSRRNNMETVLSKSWKLDVNMTDHGFAVHPTTSKPGVCSAGAQLVTGHVWEVSLGGNGSLLGCFNLGCGQEDTLPCWWQGQAVLWRCNLLHLTAEQKLINFGRCLLPGQKWPSPSLRSSRSPPWSPWAEEHPTEAVGEQLIGMSWAALTPSEGEDKAEVRGNYLFLFLPPHLSQCAGASRGGWLVVDWHQPCQLQLPQSSTQGWEQGPVWLDLQYWFSPGASSSYAGS